MISIWLLRYSQRYLIYTPSFSQAERICERMHRQSSGHKNLTSKVFRKVPTNLRNEGLLIYSFTGTGRVRAKTAALATHGWQVAHDLGVPSQCPSNDVETQSWIRRILTTKNELTMKNLLLEAQSYPQEIPNFTPCSMMEYSARTRRLSASLSLPCKKLELFGRKGREELAS